MKIHRITTFILTGVLISFFSTVLSAQNSSEPPVLMKRTKVKSEIIDFGAGGTISIVGAPVGSVEIEGWNKNQVEISAEIEVIAENEADLARLAEVCGYAVEDGLGHLRIHSVGTHDKKYLKKIDKKFPKRLRGAPFRVDYKIRVPNFSDLEIDGGRGDLILKMVEGTMRIKYLESNAKLNLIGGSVQATIGAGTVDVTIATRSWRGRFAEVQVARGDLNVWLPQNLNANLTAKVLRTGKIDNSYKMLKPLRRTNFTDSTITATAGNGGAELSFTVGDGMLKIGDFEKIAKK